MISATANDETSEPGSVELDRRDFLYVATGAMAAVGTAVTVWPFIDSMNPSADLRAVSLIEVDLAPIEIGQRVTVVRQGKSIFIDRRTPERIARAKADDDNPSLIDPATDASRGGLLP